MKWILHPITFDKDPRPDYRKTRKDPRLESFSNNILTNVINTDPRPPPTQIKEEQVPEIIIIDDEDDKENTITSQDPDTNYQLNTTYKSTSKDSPYFKRPPTPIKRSSLKLKQHTITKKVRFEESTLNYNLNIIEAITSAQNNYEDTIKQTDELIENDSQLTPSQKEDLATPTPDIPITLEEQEPSDTTPKSATNPGGEQNPDPDHTPTKEKEKPKEKEQTKHCDICKRTFKSKHT